MNNSSLGSNWKDVRSELFSAEEIAESNLRVDVICQLIKERQKRGISQKKLEELSGVKQPVIARIEKGTSNPRISTVLKLMAPLGLTLKVVPLDSE